MTIYLDAVWLLNLLLDLMLLLLTARLSKTSTSLIPLLLSAFVASAIVPISVYFPNTILLHPIGKLIYSLFIILVGFGWRNVRTFFQTWLIFYFVTFVLGGGLTAIHFMFNSPVYFSGTQMFTTNNGYGDPVSWLFVILGFPFVWLYTKKTMDKQKLINYQKQQQFKIMINNKEKQVVSAGYLDSANHLVDPISKKPVIIVDQTIIKQLFSDEEIKCLIKVQDTFDITVLNESLVNRVSFVPYQGVAAGQQLLLVFRPDQFIIFDQQELHSCSKVLVGLRFEQLTADQSYHCLLNPQIFKDVTIQTA